MAGEVVDDEADDAEEEEGELEEENALVVADAIDVLEAPLADPGRAITLNSKHYATQAMMKGLFAGYNIIERFNRMIRQMPMEDQETQARLDHCAEKLMRGLGRYNGTLQTVDPKNLKGRTRKEFRQIVLKLLSSHINEEDMQRAGLATSNSHRGLFIDPEKAADDALDLYEKILEKFQRIGIEADSVCVAAWFGFNWALAESFKAAYEGFRLIMGNITESHGWRRFRADNPEFRRYFLDLQFESIGGDQSISIDMKQVFHLINYAAYSNVPLEQIVVDFRSEEVKGLMPLEDTKKSKELLDELLTDPPKEYFTLAEVFELAALVDSLGWLKETRDIGIEVPWERVHYLWQRVYSTVRNPLMNTFMKEVVNVKQQTVKIRYTEVDRYDYPFQIVEGDGWRSGVLPGVLKLIPLEKDMGFELMRYPQRCNLKYMAMAQGTGKTTLITSLVALSVFEEKAAVFTPLSDNYNWPTIAFIPQMEIKIHNHDRNKVYHFNRELGIAPRPLPTLILNIVKDPSELRGVRLTKYDRLILVEDHESFYLDFEKILDELARIASEPQFDINAPAGLVAVRYLGRSGKNERNKMYDVELENAANFLHSCLELWRPTHLRTPVRVSIDEAYEVAATSPESADQMYLRGRMEKFVRSARRFDVPMDFATQLVKDLSQKVRDQVQDTFWKNLPMSAKKSSSQHDLLLAGLEIEQDSAQAIKSLQRDPNFANSRLVFWHNAISKEVNLIQPMPAPFMCQAENMDIPSIYSLYIKRKGIDPDKFYVKEPAVLMNASETRARDEKTKRSKRSGGEEEEDEDDDSGVPEI